MAFSTAIGADKSSIDRQDVSGGGVKEDTCFLRNDDIVLPNFLDCGSVCEIHCFSASHGLQKLKKGMLGQPSTRP